MKYFFNVVNPFNQEIIGAVPIFPKDKIDDIINKSFDYECPYDGTERAKLLLQISDELNSIKIEMATLMSHESGIALSQTMNEVERTIIVLKEASAIANKINDIDWSSLYDSIFQQQAKLTVISEPLDLVFAITPFNLPLHQVVGKIAPAIASGTSIIVKPSEKTPMTALRFGEILKKVGLSENFVRIITTNNPSVLVNKIIGNKRVQLVSYTGSVKIGKLLANSIPKNGNELCKFTAELGGNSVFVIMDDADLKKAAKICLEGAFGNGGQRCTAIKRILIVNSVAEDFKRELLSMTQNLSYGDPMVLKNKLGTLIDKNAAINVEKMVNAAIENGAELVYGNRRIGAVYSPTILDFVDPTSELVINETFGPVAPIIRIDNIEDAINIANSVDFKLAGAIMTAQKDLAHHMANKIKVGQFNWNNAPSYRTEVAPFGGFGISGNYHKEGLVCSVNEMRRIRTFYTH